ncbi:ABC transporter substrate-binding protein [Rhodoligotrophos defluvii]|uniref:ABC transporter substrate-binding protein n=1 Tax=Rhodoligotrophos defluvii TaxID=2561934 RepID=UPI0014853AC1|nr:ABC transporter substrate-binding protein [Rhodoligotrophos defluvii]
MAKTWIIAGLLLAFAVAPGQAADRLFTIGSWGGDYTEAQRKALFDPFAEKHGIKYDVATYSGGTAEFKAMKQTGQALWDAVTVETPDLVAGCDDGLFERLDWARLGGKDRLVPGAASECGAGALVLGLVLGYRAGGGAQPKSWADFWDVEAFPGKRGMRKSPRSTLEAALMADGVSPDKVYEVLSTPEGVDRAFHKLAELKPNILWWEATAQSAEWLATGEVVMSMSPSTRIWSRVQNGANLGIVWNEAIYLMDSWVIPANSPYLDTAYAFLKWVTSPEAQAAMINIYPLGPTAVGADKLIRDDLKPYVTDEARLKQGLIDSETFWVDHLEELNKRFNAWLSR